eukprot:15431061-Alexandrium_andersonii.AAC.1
MLFPPGEEREGLGGGKLAVTPGERGPPDQRKAAVLLPLCSCDWWGAERSGVRGEGSITLLSSKSLEDAPDRTKRCCAG